jgi:hypothetical protein
MVEAVIYALIYICLLALVIYLVIWVLQTIAGIALPPKVIQIVWIIFALICILVLVRLLLPHSGRLLGAMLPVLA